jgi:4-amino-4-deoxy-L-arabinose transferase-like glycosyltransferase
MDWNRRFFFLLAISTALRLLYLFVAPADLAADEAYYWDWSRQLDWGYYSKPPLIAWIIALSTRSLGSTPAMVRLPAVLLGAVGGLALFLLARRMFGARTGFWTAAAGLAAPGASVLGFIMTIDAPLVCFWCCALYLFWRGLESEKGDVLAWCGLAAALALGMLSKQMMAVFILLMFVFLAASREDRHHLKSWKPYLYSAAALSALIPDIWWNQQHGWITFEHTAHHFESTGASFLLTFADFIGGQLLVVSPVTWLLFAALCAVLVRKLKSQDRRVLYLLIFSALPLAVFVIGSFRQKMQPNWPAAFYPAGMVLLAAWACGKIAAGGKMDSWSRVFRHGVYTGAVMALVVYTLPFLAEAFPGARALGRLQGWRELGRQTGAVLKSAPRPGRTFVMAFDRQMTSELAFYLPEQPRVFAWRNAGAAVRSQYDLWDGPEAGMDALIVVQESSSFKPETVSPYFGSVSRIEGAVPGAPGRGSYAFYLGFSLKEWPGGSRNREQTRPASAGQ